MRTPSALAKSAVGAGRTAARSDPAASAPRSDRGPTGDEVSGAGGARQHRPLRADGRRVRPAPLRAQWHDRQESALEWRIRRANLPERWSLETLSYARRPGVNRKQIRAFAELDFVAKHENLVLVGQAGVGQNRTRVRPVVERLAERPPLLVRSRARSDRRDVRLAGRPLHAPVTWRNATIGTPLSSRPI
jgi:IstB-like ATP binding protein